MKDFLLSVSFLLLIVCTVYLFMLASDSMSSTEIQRQQLKYSPVTIENECSKHCKNLFSDISNTWGADGGQESLGDATLRCFNECLSRHE